MISRTGSFPTLQWGSSIQIGQLIMAMNTIPSHQCNVFLRRFLDANIPRSHAKILLSMVKPQSSKIVMVNKNRNPKKFLKISPNLSSKK